MCASRRPAVGSSDWLGGTVISSQVCHSAPKVSCPPGREQSCVWWPHQPESECHGASGTSDPLREASRCPQAGCKAPPHCRRRGVMLGVVLPIWWHLDGVHAELG